MSPLGLVAPRPTPKRAGVWGARRWLVRKNQDFTPHANRGVGLEASCQMAWSLLGLIDDLHRFSGTAFSDQAHRLRSTIEQLG